MTKTAAPQNILPTEGIKSAEGELLATTDLSVALRREQARLAFENSPFINVARNWEAAPSNWKGFEPEWVQSIPTRRENERAQMIFALTVSESIETGQTIIKRGSFDAYTMRFSQNIGGGTGEAAASLVADSLKNKGIEAHSVGRKVYFNAPQYRNEMADFLSSILDPETGRRRVSL